MAIQIPKAPEIVGTQPVLRQPDSINAKFEQPNFKVDVSAPAQAVKDVGDAYASFVDQQTETLMGAACNQFNHDVSQEEESLKANNKGIYANDLYARLEKKATAILDDITGEPKDDGRVRIANPELRKRFRDWASKQMPAYQARMTNYTASELDKANKEILRDGIKRVNDTVTRATTGHELVAANEEYIRAARLSSPGMSKEYQLAEAARMMDEALLNKMDTTAKTNVMTALHQFYNIPEINAGMSSTSEASFFKTVEEVYVDQGASHTADILAANGSADSSGFLHDYNLSAAFPNASKSEKQKIVSDILKKAKEIDGARQEALKETYNVRMTGLAAEGAKTDINDTDAVTQHYMSLSSYDQKAADQYLNRVQRYHYVKNLVSERNKLYEEHPVLSEAREAGISYDSIETFRQEYSALQNPTMTEDEYVSSKMSESVSNAYNITPEEVGVIAKAKDLDEEYDAYLALTADNLNNGVYKEFYMKAANGEWSGEYDPRLDGLDEEMYKNLEQVVAGRGAIKEVYAQNPEIKSTVKREVDKYKKKGYVFQNKLERQIAKDFIETRNRTGAYPDDVEQIIIGAIKKVKSPTQVLFEDNLYRESIDAIEANNINMYLEPSKAKEVLRRNGALDTPKEKMREWLSENDKATPEKAFRALVSSLPKNAKDIANDMKESIIDHIEKTGDWDFVIDYLDSLANKFE